MDRVKKALRIRTLVMVTVPLLAIACVIIAARSSRSAAEPYQLATQVPRGPLVYAQFSDLPGMINQWNESRLKADYYNSANYKSFKERHLALRLIERLEEFNAALGFDLNTGLISSTAEKNAAIAIYDIGKLNVVFVSPLNRSKFSLTEFTRKQNDFETRHLANGTEYHLKMVDEHGGRERQSLTYGLVKDEFILASDEQLFLRTAANILGNGAKDSLADDPSFRTLSQSVVPHFATVWLDQTKLNGDYYFRRYWIYQNSTELKNFRNCIFDLDREDNRWTERREFLVAGGDSKSPIPLGANLTDLQSMVPAGIPLVKVSSLENDSTRVGNVLGQMIEDPTPQERRKGSSGWSWHWYSDSEFEAPTKDETTEEDRYSSLSDNINETIDNPYDADVVKESGDVSSTEAGLGAELQKIVSPARPITLLTAESTKAYSGPLFAEFRRLSIVRLTNVAALDRLKLEAAIENEMMNRRSAKGVAANLQWVTHDEKGITWRELDLPMLGWGVYYAVRNNDLIISTNSDLLAALTGSDARQNNSASTTSFVPQQLTIINFEQRKQAFDDVVNELDKEPAKAQSKSEGTGGEELSASQREFFSGNLGSLLDVTSGVNRIEIRRSASANRMSEEIQYELAVREN